jgi:hypothetical protein
MVQIMFRKKKKTQELTVTLMQIMWRNRLLKQDVVVVVVVVVVVIVFVVVFHVCYS